MITKPKSQPLQLLRLLYLLPIIVFSLAMSAQVKKEMVVKDNFTEESAIIFEHKDGKEWIGVKVPAGAFFTWLANGRLVERSIIKEGGWMNNRGIHYINGDIVTLAYAGKDIIYYGRGLEGVMAKDQGFSFLEHAVVLKGGKPL